MNENKNLAAARRQAMHYFLFSTRVVYVRDKVERGRDLNVLIVSHNGFVCREDLDRVQLQAQARFFNEFDKKHQSNVVDVFIAGVSYLGYMTDQQFHKGFPEGDIAPEQPEQPEKSEPETQPEKESN